MDKYKYIVLVYMHRHVHTHYVCHMPSNYNIITDKQGGGEAWPPATISWYCHELSHDIAIQKNPTIWALLTANIIYVIEQQFTTL